MRPAAAGILAAVSCGRGAPRALLAQIRGFHRARAHEPRAGPAGLPMPCQSVAAG